MSKASKKKFAHQRESEKAQTRKQKSRGMEQKHAIPGSIAPTFNAEQVGVPATFYNWLGRKVASLGRKRGRPL